MNESATAASVAARTIRLSGLVGAIAIVFLAGMFTAFAAGAQSIGLTLGWINDVLVLVTYALLAPTVVAVHGLTRTRWPVPAAVLAVLGLAGIAWVIFLQGLLIVGALTFEEQIGLVSVGFLGLGVWFVAGGWLAGRSGVVERGAWMGLLGATYLGYPLWALWIARRLEDVVEPARPADTAIEPTSGW